VRLFLAVNLPTRLRLDLDTRLDTARASISIAWSRPETWHLTLAFLGDWPRERLPELGAALRAAVAEHEPFVIKPGGIGTFPHRGRPRVLFLQLDGDDPLRELAVAVRRAVDSVWRDGPQDHKTFRPHVTVARIKRPLALAEQASIRTLDLGNFESFEVETVALMASELRPAGARHTVVESLRLGG